MCKRLSSASVVLNAIIILFTFAVSNKAIGQAFNLEGIITYRAFVHGETVRELHHKLVANVNGRNWLFSIDATGPTNGLSLLYSAGYDGENVYCVGTRTVPNQALSRDAVPTSSGYIAPNELLPSLPTMGATFAWFLLAPDAKEKTFSANKGRCIWDDPLLYRHKVSFPINIWTNENGSFFTVSVVWQNDGIIRFEDDQQALREKRWPKPYDNGYTNAIYTVTYSNVDGIDIPSSASLTSYFPDYLAKSQPGKLIAQDGYYFTLTSIVPQCEQTNFRPALPPMTVVWDRRLTDSHPDYHPFKIVTNGGPWRAVPLDVLASNYVRYEEDLKRHPFLTATAPVEHIRRAQRQVVVGCMVAVSTLACVLIIRRTKSPT